MDSIDITDLAFSLGNISAANEILSSTTDSIPEIITETLPEFITSDIPNAISGTIPDAISSAIPSSIPEINATTIDSDDNSMMILFGIGFVAMLIGIFVYNYYNKNKHVRFQDNVDICYDKQVCGRSEF